jgi:hypothetical protein
MHRTTLLYCLGAGLGAHLMTACGDDGDPSVSVSATEASSGFTTDPEVTSTGPIDPTGGQEDTTGIGGSMTESASGTTTTGDVLTTDATTSTTTGVDPDTTASSSTSTGPDPDTSTGSSSTGSDESTDTGGSSSTGEETTDGTTGNPLDCPLIAQHTPCDPDSTDALHAIGLNCTSLGGNFQNNVNAIAVANLDFQAPPPLMGERAWQVARSYGTFVDPNTNEPFWSPREGEKVLLISSGLVPPPNNQGAIIIPDGDVYGDTFSSFNNQAPWDDNTMPPPMSPQNGSPDPQGFTNCDGVGDCSNTVLAQWMLGNSNAEDKMWFRFDLTAPALANGDMVDAKGYTFDFAFFSAEFPEYVDSGFNDIFIVWQDSEAYTGNVTFINEQPLTVTALWPIDFEGQCNVFDDPFCNNPADPHLEGTGHIQDGGATGWYKATGGVNPGETFSLSFGIFDMGDSSFDTTAILDNFQWDCEGCIPNEVMGCGIDPQ